MQTPIRIQVIYGEVSVLCQKMNHELLKWLGKIEHHLRLFTFSLALRNQMLLNSCESLLNRRVLEYGERG